MINPQPGGAVYAQLAAKLRHNILDGHYPAGQTLPSERSLSQEYGIARGTVRQAMAVLRAEGLVDPRRGHAAVVREHPEVQDLVVPAGATVTARMPTLDERVTLSIGEGVPVLSVEHADETVRVYPADRWRVRLSGT
ncbi:GntR family transcriptional regulator [Actinoplanes sp. NPDC051494]|uniref:GntR family transcriptional regulator n=1 Tax=Actinoplanes sp. NPDC051494 TaxID=3363907 RepID=UPI0037B887CD